MNGTFPRSLFPTRLSAAVVVLLLVGQGLGMAAGQEGKEAVKRDPAAVQAVKDTLKVYRECTTYREKWSGAITMVIGKAQLPLAKLKGEIVFQAPGNVAAWSEDENGNRDDVAVVDGKFVVVSGSARLAISGPAPKPDDTDGYGALLEDAAPPIPIGFMGARLGGFNLDEVGMVASGVAAESEWLKGLEGPEKCDPYTLDVGGEGNVVPAVVWIDRESKLVRQFALEASSEGEGEGGQGPQSVALRIVVRIDEAAVNEAVEQAEFACKVPEGYKRVEVASAAEARKAIDDATAKAEAEQQRQGQQQGEEERKGLVGQTPPDFTAQTLDGKQVRLSDLKGRPIVLDFWATWCPPCRKEMPVLNEFAVKLKEKGLVVLCVSVDRNVEAVKKFVQDNGYKMTVWWVEPRPDSEAGKILMEKYGLNAIPRTLYITRDFVVKHDMVGLHPRDEMIKAVADLGVDTSALEEEK